MRKVCSFRKLILVQVQCAQEMGVFAVHEGEAPLLSYQIFNAVAAACKLFKPVDWSKEKINE